jgi:hypothetical protein
MSVSSVGSQLSVGLHGQAVNLEKALDETVAELQKHLNMVQVHLRCIAATVEQDNDFKIEVDESDKLDDDLREMSWLFDDLRSMAYDLISLPDDEEDKIWFRAHKAQRKLDEKRTQADHKAKAADEKRSAKLALKVARSTIAEDDGENDEKMA